MRAMSILAVLLLIVGLGVMGYFFFVFEVETDDEVFSLRVLGETFGEARVRTTDPERVELRRNAIVAGAALAVVGAGLLVTAAIYSRQ